MGSVRSSPQLAPMRCRTPPVREASRVAASRHPLRDAPREGRTGPRLAPRTDPVVRHVSHAGESRSRLTARRRAALPRAAAHRYRWTTRGAHRKRAPTPATAPPDPAGAASASEGLASASGRQSPQADRRRLHRRFHHRGRCACAWWLCAVSTVWAYERDSLHMSENAQYMDSMLSSSSSSKLHCNVC